jgi:CubicO group peptidase (beta-lactamase class C family)
MMKVKNHTITFLVCSFVLLLASCRQPEVSLADRFDQYFSGIFSNNEPGASVVILQGDQVLFKKSYGLADLNTREPVTSSTLFNLGSISKTFVAYGILILREQGKLSVYDPLSRYFPEFRNRAIADQVTIRHLLTHTSGLPDLRKVKEDSVFYLTARDEENWAPILQADKLNFTPGEHYEYSNPAFNALALIIEKKSGVKWQQYIQDNILIPADMMKSTITDGPHPESGVAHAYVRSGEQWKEKDYGEEPTFAAAGNGGVWSSVDELILYEKAIREFRFARPETIAASRTVDKPLNWKADDQPFIGWSWFIEKVNGIKTIGHAGTQGGFFCHYVYMPETDVLYIVLANREYPREETFARVLQLLDQAALLNKKR